MKKSTTNLNIRYRFVASNFNFCSCKVFCICSQHDSNLSSNIIIILYIFSIYRLVNSLFSSFSFWINAIIVTSRKLLNKLEREIVLAILNSLFTKILASTIFIFLLYLVEFLLIKYKFEFLRRNVSYKTLSFSLIILLIRKDRERENVEQLR